MEDNRVTQRLSSGLLIRQDFRDSVRWVLFETDVPEHPYWTNGGTAFVVNLGNDVVALTARHACKAHWPKIVITDTKNGSRYVPAKMAYRADRETAWGHAEDSDIADINVVQFHDDGDVSFFADSAYRIDAGTVCRSQPGDHLVVHGVLYDGSTIAETVSPLYCELDLDDAGQRFADGTPLSDLVLRRATARLKMRPDFQSLVGVSGAPVFNKTQGKLCGLVLRAGMTATSGTVYYAEIEDVLTLARAVQSGQTIVSYAKATTP